MKTRIQFTPEFVVAGICVASWFAVWLLAFRPSPLQPARPLMIPEVTRLVTDDATLRKLSTPTLFALPSDEGFSGRFVEDRITVERTPDLPAGSVRYLPRKVSEVQNVDKARLTSETRLPQRALPVPGVVPRPAVRPAAGTRLFLSPQLKSRAGDFSSFEIASDGLSETLRVNVVVSPDGRVKHAFFEKPVTNAALLNAIRKLPFHPADRQTEGWIDIRFEPEGQN